MITTYNHRLLNVLRWIARIWTIPIFIFVVGEVTSPDPYVMTPIPTTDYIELSLMGIAILGLVFAWRWEMQGAILTLIGLLAHSVAFYAFRGHRYPLLLPIIVGGPAILLLIYWVLSHPRLKTA